MKFEDISPTTGSIKTGDFLASHVFFFQGSTWATLVQFCLFTETRPKVHWLEDDFGPGTKLLGVADWFQSTIGQSGAQFGHLFVKVLALSKSGSYSDYVNYYVSLYSSLSLMISFSFLQHPIEGEGCTISFCTS